MILTASLLFIFAQQAADPRAAWSEWRNGLLAAKSLDWQGSQVWRYSVRAEDETAEGTDREPLVPDQEASLELRISAQGEFLLNGKITARVEGSRLDHFGVLVDRSGARAWSVTEHDGVAEPELFGVRIGREALDEIYGLLRDEMLRIAMEEPESGAESWIEHAGRNFPAELNAFLHPTLAAHRAATLFEVQEFERRDGEVRVLVQVRWNSGPLRGLVEGVEEAAAEAVETGAAGTLRDFLAGLEQTRGELIFDAADGSLRSVSLHCALPAAAFGVEQNGLLRATLGIMARRHSESSAPALTGPPSSIPWLDLEPYLEPFRSFLQPAIEVPLITPGPLPPPPPPVY